MSVEMKRKGQLKKNEKREHVGVNGGKNGEIEERKKRRKGGKWKSYKILSIETHHSQKWKSYKNHIKIYL